MSPFFVMLCILILLPLMKISRRYVFGTILLSDMDTYFCKSIWLWIIQPFAPHLLQGFHHSYGFCWLLTISCYYYFASETSRDKSSIFPCLLIWITIIFWTSRLYARLSVIQAFVLGFCSSGYNFAIPSSRLYLAVQTLGIDMRFADNYPLRGL